MKNSIPEGSLIEKFLPADHSDVHACVVEAEHLSADDIQVAFWTNSPKWVQRLMNLRNSLVKLVGLKGEKENKEAYEDCIRSASPYGMVSIPAKSENETVLRLDDSHLSALISVHIQHLERNMKLVSATTLVHFHNRLGRVYFFFIKPFHHLVVKGMLKRSVELSRGRV